MSGSIHNHGMLTVSKVAVMMLERGVPRHTAPQHCKYGHIASASASTFTCTQGVLAHQELDIIVAHEQ